MRGVIDFYRYHTSQKYLDKFHSFIRNYHLCNQESKPHNIDSHNCIDNHQYKNQCNPYNHLGRILSSHQSIHSSIPFRYGSRGLVRGMVLGLAQ